MELDAAAGNPRDFEEVVDEPRKVRDLPLDDVACPRRARGVVLRAREEVERVLDGRERVPELVGQDAQELVLAPIPLLERFEHVAIRRYDEDGIARVYEDLPADGTGVIIAPSGSRVHLSFALNAPRYHRFATAPLLP